MSNEDFLITTSYKVVKGNDLIQKSRYFMPPSQQRLFAYICSLIRPPTNSPDCDCSDEQLIYEFNIRDYCRLCGINYTNSGGSVRNSVRSTIKSLADQSVFILNDDDTEELCRWLDAVKIDRKTGMVTVTIGKKLSPYLFQLKEHFTQYELWNILALKSVHGIRLYELFKSNAYLSSWNVSVEELRQLLFVPRKNCTACSHMSPDNCISCSAYLNYYQDFKYFNSRVIRKSVLEINKYTDLNVRYTVNKYGYEAKSLYFVIETKTMLESASVHMLMFQKMTHKK